MPNWKKLITSGSNASLASLTISTGSSNALVIEGSGSTIFDVQGSQGQLFSITDSLSGSLFSVNDISGIPILEVDSDGTVSMGTFGAYELVVNSGGVTGSSFTGSFVGDGSGLTGVTATGVSANSVALGTDTTGNYVATITGGTGISSTGATSGEGIAHTLSISDNGVDNTKLADMGASTIKGKTAGSSGNPEDLTAAQTKTILSLDNVENTALSTWAGSTSITTLGTITTGDVDAILPTGTVSGSAQITIGSTTGTLAVDRGGTGQTSYTNGQLLIGNTTGNTLAKATLTAGNGIDITNGAGSITITGETASDTNPGIVELATTAETTTGTDATRAVTPDGLKDGYQGSTNVTTLGTIGTGTWQGSVIASAYLDSDTAHLSGTQTFTGTKSFSNTVALNDSDSLSFESGKHWITYNDGQGNFNIRMSHYSNGSGQEECTEAGYIAHWEYGNSSGLWDFQVSDASMAVGELIGVDANWYSQLQITPTDVSLRYQGSEKINTTSTGVSVTGNITVTGTGNFSGGVTGSSFSGSFVGDGSGLTGLPSAAITSYTSTGNNRIITSVDATSVQGEANLTFDGSTFSVTGTGNFSGGVTGSSFTGSFVGDGSGLTGIAGGGGGSIFAATGSIQSTTNDLQITGSVIITSNLTVEGRLIERSTRTLKENIQPLREELTNVEKLNPVSFDWIESGKSDIGFIAEELNEVYPLLVTKGESGDIKGLHYTKLTSILVKAVQELSTRNKELESRVEKLEARLRIRF